MTTPVLPVLGSALYLFGTADFLNAMGTSYSLDKPMPATVSKLNDDGTYNMNFIDQYGNAYAIQDVALIQDGEQAPSHVHWAYWPGTTVLPPLEPEIPPI